MNRRILLCVLVTVLLFSVGSVKAQQPGRIPRIVYLSLQSRPSPTLVLFKEGLRDLGLIEGKQIDFEYRYAGGDIGKLPELATELVSLKVDVISV